MDKSAIVVGSGFAGMSVATHLASKGWCVTVLEKHAAAGGRARQLIAEGFTFDMGPSWYWMPDVFDRYFSLFGHKTSDFYTLQRLDPSYRIYWPQGFSDIPAKLEDMYAFFEKTEAGAAVQLKKFLAEAKYKYETGINNLVYKPGQSILEFVDMDVIKGVFKLDIFGNMQQHVHKYFKHPHLRYLMEFPVLFLGALAQNTPALYSLMNYADIVGGTWWPSGGMHSIVQAMYTVACKQGVQFIFEQDVQEFTITNNKITGVKCVNNSNVFSADVVVSAADYHFTETKLLPPALRNYNDTYWQNRQMAPSSLLYYVGLNKKLSNVLHHSLFFDVDFDTHANEIYTTKQWPSNPLFYVSNTSATDNNVVPAGGENLFFLIPITAGFTDDTEQKREEYFVQIVQRMEAIIGQTILQHIVYKKSFATADFISEYNSYKGNAYGLANTLMQTAILKPSITNKHVSNLFYTGQLTVPGPGVPPSLISGEVVANWVDKKWKK